MTEPLKTEFPFELPLGYVDSSGARHRTGMMRLATAGDEIVPLRDPRVQSNPAYVSIIILTRVITRLGTLDMINTQVVEDLFSADYAYLQDLYNRINHQGDSQLSATCPKCGHDFTVETTPPGEV